MAKIKFPEQYILRGDFRLHSGERSTIKYDVEMMMTNPFYLHYILDKMPFSDHYIGIASGGALMALATHCENPTSQFSIIKKVEFLGERPTRPWALVDDVTTTERSLREAILIVGSEPEEIIVAVDRREPINKMLKITSLFYI